MPPRRKISHRQFELLVEFAETHRDIALGRLPGGPLGKQSARNIWDTVALQLNSLGEGAHKTGYQWQRYWIETKAKIKNKASDCRRMATGTGGGPIRLKPLTPLEERVVALIGRVAVEGLPGVQLPRNESVEHSEPSLSSLEALPHADCSGLQEEVQPSQREALPLADCSGLREEVQPSQREALPLAGCSGLQEKVQSSQREAFSFAGCPGLREEVQPSQREALPLAGCSGLQEEVQPRQREALPLAGCSGLREEVQPSQLEELPLAGDSSQPVPQASGARRNRPSLHSATRGSRSSRMLRESSNNGNVPSWARQLETRRIAVEQQHAEALQLFAEALTRIAETLERIERQMYLRPNLRAHLLTHSGKRPYLCVVCNKSFTTKWNLKLHRWTHVSRSAKPYKCSLCKGAFIRHTEYVSHMNAHKSVRPYTCKYCGCQFIRKYNCQRHVREHESAKRYACKVPECGKTFHRSYYLSEHMKVHSGARPFACNICGKTSSNKSNHNKHVKIHHAREPIATEA